LRENISLKIGSVGREFKSRKQTIVQEAQTVRRNALEGGNGSYIEQEMLPIYQAGRLEHGRGKFVRQKELMESLVTIDIYKKVGTRFKEGLIATMKKGFKEFHKELLHALDQIGADLERCTATEDMKLDPDLQVRITKELDPLKAKVELLARDLPKEKDMIVKPNTQGKRMAMAKELKGEGVAFKKKKV
jgi:hypothetical protein